MKRIQLFEFEDLCWFPNSIRQSMTQMITLLHRWLGTADHLAKLLAEMIQQSGCQQIVDLCSGDGGPLPEVVEKLHGEHGIQNLSLMLTDLYPNAAAAERIQSSSPQQIQYVMEPVDARAASSLTGPCIRTLVCSFHHFSPGTAKQILVDAMTAGDPLLIYEISDNSFPPKYLWWIGLPLNFVFGLVVAGCVRPKSVMHCVFSFIFPAIPFCFAWDGAVSNVRTYAGSDLDELLKGLESDRYQWRVGTLEARPARHLYVVGMPVG